MLSTPRSENQQRASQERTSEKELDALAPLPLIHSIHTGLRGYEGTRLGQPRPCLIRSCISLHHHGVALIGFGTRGPPGPEACRNSMYVFRNGCPEMSFAHRVSDFTYEDVMGQSTPTGPNVTGKPEEIAA